MEPGPVCCTQTPEAGLRLCAYLGSAAGLGGGRRVLQTRCRAGAWEMHRFR